MQTLLQFKHYLVGSKEVESLDNVVALRKENVGERFAGLEPRDCNFEKRVIKGSLSLKCTDNLYLEEKKRKVCE